MNCLLSLIYNAMEGTFYLQGCYFHNSIYTRKTDGLYKHLAKSIVVLSYAFFLINKSTIPKIYNVPTDLDNVNQASKI